MTNAIIDSLEKQLDDELTFFTVVAILFGDEVPTNDEVIRRVRELDTYWKQMHGRRGE